tara:strand:- start:74 stop:289 length:216 start_codon:yes stop_codon:yes gene_type:complete
MAKSGASKGAKKVNAFNDGKLDGVNIAQNITPGMPDYVYESIKRQYSGKDYTIEDKKNVINYYKKQKKGKV